MLKKELITELEKLSIDELLEVRGVAYDLKKRKENESRGKTGKNKHELTACQAVESVKLSPELHQAESKQKIP